MTRQISHIGTEAPRTPAQQRAELLAVLRLHRVVCTVQLDRWGLLPATVALNPPSTIKTVRTRVQQEHSAVPLQFVSAPGTSWLHRAPRELMHYAALAETRSQLILAAGQQWRLVDLRGQQRQCLPDATIVTPASTVTGTLSADLTRDWAVEFDAGYTRPVIYKKLLAYHEQGFTRILWASSVHERVRSVHQLGADLARHGHLPQLTRLDTLFVDFWSRHNPYERRPRCHKPYAQSLQRG